MRDLWVAIGLMMALEGFLYALFPEGMKRMMQQLLQLTPSTLRTFGLLLSILGVGLVWLIRH